MKNKEYRFDYENNTIILAKKFAKAAGVLNTPEYRKLTQLRKDYPDFTIALKQIEKPSKPKETYRNLNYDAMRSYIKTKEGEKSENLAKLNGYINLNKGSGCYPRVKAWFLKEYPSYTDVKATMDAIAA